MNGISRFLFQLVLISGMTGIGYALESNDTIKDSSSDNISSECNKENCSETKVFISLTSGDEYASYNIDDAIKFINEKIESGNRDDSVKYYFSSMDKVKDENSESVYSVEEAKTSTLAELSDTLTKLKEEIKDKINTEIRPEDPSDKLGPDANANELPEAKAEDPSDKLGPDANADVLPEAKPEDPSDKPDPDAKAEETADAKSDVVPEVNIESSEAKVEESEVKPESSESPEKEADVSSDTAKD